MSVIRCLIDAINQEFDEPPRMLVPLPGQNEMVDYEELLEREKDGESMFTLYKPIKKKFRISTLLHGISKPSELESLGDMTRKILQNQEQIMIQQDANAQSVETQYEVLAAKLDQKLDTADLLSGISRLNNLQASVLRKDVLRMLSSLCQELDGLEQENFALLLAELKSSDPTEVKLKLRLPLISLLGIDLETKFDVKKWGKQMYQKYQWEIFDLLRKKQPPALEE